MAKNDFSCVQYIGLQQSYLTDTLFRDSIQDVILAFDELCNHCSIDEQPVLDYFETNYRGELQRRELREFRFPSQVVEYA